MHLQDVIQFQASTGKERKLLGKYCDYLMKDWLHLQGNVFLKYFASPFKAEAVICKYCVKGVLMQSSLAIRKTMCLI